jgi:NADPH-dependent 2,4-dienoyl-CoA reductase/sulfur reductase-like enzyme
MQGVSVKKLTAGPNGQVGAVELSDGTVLDTDLVVVGIGAKPTIGPFVEAGLKSAEGAIEVLFEIVQNFNLGLVFSATLRVMRLTCLSFFLSFFLD